MLNKIKLICIGILLTTIPKLGYSQNIYDSTNAKRYADHLFKSKEYLRASIEFERVCFLDSQNWDAHYFLIKSYRKAALESKGIQYYQTIAYKVPHPLKNKFSHEANICRFKQNSGYFLNKSEKDSIVNLAYFKSPSMLLDHNWKLTKTYLETQNYKSNPTLTQYYDFANEGMRQKYKKPALAAALSTVVPGLGKVYTGYYKDGIIAFVMTGISAYQAYRGYNVRGPKSGLFIIYSGLTAGFYVGNIYGAVKSAKQRNRKMNERIDNKTKAEFYKWAE